MQGILYYVLLLLICLLGLFASYRNRFGHWAAVGTPAEKSMHGAADMRISKDPSEEKFQHTWQCTVKRGDPSLSSFYCFILSQGLGFRIQGLGFDPSLHDLYPAVATGWSHIDSSSLVHLTKLFA